MFGAPDRIIPGILPSTPSGPLPLRVSVQIRSRRICQTVLILSNEPRET